MPNASGPDHARAPVILCVDDEPGILAALRRLFRAHGMQVLVAESGRQALEILEREPVDLVISDMRMPEMDGVEFLEHVRERQPDTLRLLLTGYADVASIMGAINRGEIYRYIAKPWDDRDIILIVRAALERSALQAEKRRLEALVKTQNEQLRAANAELESQVAARTAELRHANDALHDANDRLRHSFLTSIKLFSALIELRDSKLAGRSRRVADMARHLAQAIHLESRPTQEIFVAGLLHAIGQIGFDDALLKTPQASMSARQREVFRQHPQRAEQLLMPLSELRSTAEVIGDQLEHYDGSGFPRGLSGRQIRVGARILAIVIAYDSVQLGLLEPQTFSPAQARDYLLQHSGTRFDPALVQQFLGLPDLPHDKATEAPPGVSASASGAAPTPPVRTVRSRELRPDMVLARDLTASSGLLLLTAGHVLDSPMIRKIIDFEHTQQTHLSVEIQEPARAP